MNGNWIFASDLHMGDGGPADDFTADAELCQLIDSLGPDDTLVIPGDLTDMPQALSLADVWKAHCPAIDALKGLESRLVIIPGNHDDPFLLWCMFGDVVRCALNAKQAAFTLGSMVVLHGHEFDKWCYGPRAWVGWSFAAFGGFLECVIHRNIDEWFSRIAAHLAGHGKHGSPKWYAKKAIGYAKKVGAKVIVMGHTHVRDYQFIDGIRYYNCGASLNKLNYRVLPKDMI